MTLHNGPEELPEMSDISSGKLKRLRQLLNPVLHSLFGQMFVLHRNRVRPGTQVLGIPDRFCQQLCAT